MSTQGPFAFGQGYTVHWDEPKTNGTGPAGRQKDNGTTGEASKPNGSTGGNPKGHETHGPLHSWDDPDWSILDDRRGDLPEFPIVSQKSCFRAGHAGSSGGSWAIRGAEAVRFERYSRASCRSPTGATARHADVVR